MQTSITRRISVTLVATALVATQPNPASAHHHPRSYCSPSRDICQSVAKAGGLRKLSITTGTRYFRRYVLCVRGPLRYDSCRAFRVHRRSDGLFGDSIPIERFGVDRPGRYTVSWYRAPKYGPPKERIGVRLGFHV